MPLYLGDDMAAPNQDSPAGGDSMAAPSVRSALTVSGSMGGREAAKTLQNASFLGVSEETVMAAPDFASGEVAARRMEAAPPVAQWAAKSAVNASLARENLDGLEQLYNSIPANSSLAFLPREAFDPQTVKQWYDIHKAAGHDFKP